MNKAIINDEIVIAYDVLKKSEIVENGKIKKHGEDRYRHLVRL